MADKELRYFRNSFFTIIEKAFPFSFRDIFIIQLNIDFYETTHQNYY